MCALVVSGHLESAARAGGCLFEDEGDVHAAEAGLLGAAVFGALQIACQVKQILNFLGCEVQQFKETAIA